MGRHAGSPGARMANLFGTTANFGYMSGARKHYLGEYPLIKRRAS